MALVSSTIPNLINGISQQPNALRLASQAEQQVNGLSSVVEGLTKRPPLKWLAKILGTVPADAFIHLINRDAVERYVVVITGGDLKVFDLAGNEKTVSFPDGKGYISSSTRDDYRAVTVADFTFLANKTVKVAMGASTSPALDYEAVVWVKQGNYGTDYEITLDGSVVASTTTPDGSDPSQVTGIQTDKIAADLKTDLDAAGGWVTTRRGSVLLIQKSGGGDFTISTQDSFGDTAMEAVKGKVQRFSELPARAFDGFTVEVVGDNTSAFDNYWMQFSDSGSVQGQGVWREVLAPSLTKGFDVSTMPHVLVREADGTFTFREADWLDRAVGDADSNPEPSFVDRYIADVFFHRNRLGFIADESVILSQSGSFFDFWRTTATTLVDNDPVDVAASHVKVSILRHAVPFNEELLLFSNQTQFILSSDSLLTPKTAIIKQATEFATNLLSRPVGAGQYVYFAFDRGRFSGIREYYTQDNQTGNDASDITSNIPQYIPSGVYKMDASSNEQTLALVSDQSQRRIYVYKYHYSGNEVVQSSWSHWELGEEDEIMDIGFVDSDLIVVVGRSDGLHLGSIPVESGYVDTGSSYATLLDYRIDETQVVSRSYDAGTDKTTVDLPYANREGTDGVLRAVTKDGVDGQVPGVVIPMEHVDSTTVELEGDHTATEFRIGEEYQFLYQFSQLLIREDATGGGRAAVLAGRLQIRNFSVGFTGTGFFTSKIEVQGTEAREYNFSGSVVGHSKIGETNLEEGKQSLPVYSRNNRAEIYLLNSTFLPCKFLSAEWEGYSVIRSRRI